MNILAISDIHGDLNEIKKISKPLSEADLVLLSGDITHFGKEKEINNIISEIKKSNSNIFAVPGNCDYPEVGKYLEEKRINIDCRVKEVNGLTIAGIGGSLPCPGRTPIEYTESEFNNFLNEIIKDVRTNSSFVLLSHQPPFGTLADMLGEGLHVGSHAIRRFIEEYQPLICFCGHIHEGRSIDRIGNTNVVNPSPLRYGSYASAIVKKGILKDITLVDVAKV